ncbi:hypothetical protein [Catenulispora rubra]|uniref:hypothetical protein n=1 Tax=Catenulispora rubra TaxID=280293 RepID=UPI00189250E4|nr:hypothetical protein [Catenulispora rubra]
MTENVTADHGWAERLNQAALAYDDHVGATIEYPGLKVSTAVCLRPQPTLTISLWTRAANHGPRNAVGEELPAHIPVELFRDDHRFHRNAPAPGGLDTAADPHPLSGARQRAARRSVMRARAARLGRLLRVRILPRDVHWEEQLDWAHRVNHAVLVYNAEDAGPTIEYPGLRVFVYLEPDGTLALNVWTRDVLDDSSLATLDDLPARIPVELFRNGDFVHRDAPIPLGGAA